MKSERGRVKSEGRGEKQGNILLNIDALLDND